MKKYLIPTIFLISVFLVSLRPHADTDFGWHYQCGKIFLVQHKLCVKNEFSYFLPNYRWANPTFLYDIAIALIHYRTGFLGISVFGSIIFVLLALCILKTAKNNWPVAAIFFYIAFFLSWSTLRLGFRSQEMSLFFLALTFFILVRHNDNSNKSFMWALIPLFTIWANTHAGFFLGPLVFLFYIFNNFALLILKQKQAQAFGHEMFVFLASLSTTLINPFGINIYKEVFRHWSMPLYTLIAEWVPPDPFNRFLAGLFLIIYLFFSVLLAIRKKNFDVFGILVLGTFCYFTFAARRNIPLFYFSYSIFVPILLSKFDKAASEFPMLVITLLIPSTLFIGALNAVDTVKFDTNYFNYCNSGYITYPCEAIEVLKDKKGNLFNTYEWGGFLIWKLPNFRVFVDGRMPAWSGENGKSPYTTFLEIAGAAPGWDKKLEQYKTDYILLFNGSSLYGELSLNFQKYGYLKLYEKNNIAVYQKTKM